MNKLRLDLDELAVESFDTGQAATAVRGTVLAHNTMKVCGHTADGLCPYDTAECSVDTCGQTCSCNTGAECNLTM